MNVSYPFQMTTPLASGDDRHVFPAATGQTFSPASHSPAYVRERPGVISPVEPVMIGDDPLVAEMPRQVDFQPQPNVRPGADRTDPVVIPEASGMRTSGGPDTTGESRVNGLGSDQVRPVANLAEKDQAEQGREEKRPSVPAGVETVTVLEAVRIMKEKGFDNINVRSIQRYCSGERRAGQLTCYWNVQSDQYLVDRLSLDAFADKMSNQSSRVDEPEREVVPEPPSSPAEPQPVVERAVDDAERRLYERMLADKDKVIEDQQKQLQAKDELLAGTQSDVKGIATRMLQTLETISLKARLEAPLSDSGFETEPPVVYPRPE